VRQIAIANRGAETATRFDEVEKLLAQPPAPGPIRGPRLRGPREDAPPPPSGRRRAADLREDEVVAALRAHRFRPTAAADALGIPRSSIYDLIQRIPGLRQASQLDREEIDAVRARVGESVEAMAEDLEVSERALRRRLGQLGLDP
jgi:two-component system nitrogen regulation response regulator GlnG